MAARIRHRRAPPAIRRTWPAGDHPVRWADRPPGCRPAPEHTPPDHDAFSDGGSCSAAAHLLVVAVLSAGQIATFDTKGAMLGQVALGSDVSG